MPRARFLIPELKSLKNWTAFLFFQKGLTLIYAGQERGVSHLPSLFDRDTVDFSCTEDEDLRGLMKRLYEIKKDSVFTDSVYRVKAQGERFLSATHTASGKKALGVFSLKGETGFVEVDFPDGFYTNLIDGSTVEVFRGGVQSYGEPIILIT